MGFTDAIIAKLFNKELIEKSFGIIDRTDPKKDKTVKIFKKIKIYSIYDHNL